MSYRSFVVIVFIVGSQALALLGRADASQHEPVPRSPAQVNAFVTPPPDQPDSDAATDDEPATADQQAAELAELRRRIDVLADEIEQLRSGEEPEEDLTDARRQALGLAPSAASAYRSTGVSFAGYGEMLFENPAGENQRGAPVAGGSQLDFLRAILYAGYRFNDRFVFNSEIEIEHANETSVEFAYLDYLVNDALTIRGGMVLIPLGLVNEFHEPNVFLGARRPQTETVIIPTTWRENGVGVLGVAGPMTYRAYLVNGMAATGFSAGGLRGGRQKGSRARAADLAFAGRLDVTVAPGISAGVGLYAGGSDQGDIIVDGDVVAVKTTIAEVHGQVQMRGFDVRGLFARAALGNAASLNRALGLTGSRAIGDTQVGGYAQIGYDVLSQRGGSIALTPYYRFEAVDTHASLPMGFLADPARDTTFHTVGVELQPIRQIVVKADYQWGRNVAHTGRNQFNLALGYAF